MPDFSVQIVDDRGAPVPAQLAFVPASSRTPSGVVRTDGEGRIALRIPRIDNMDMLVVPSRPGFWSSRHSIHAGENRIVAIPITDSPDWWRRCTGVHNAGKQGEGIIVGIVDTSFEPQPGIQHVSVHGVRRPPRQREDDGEVWRHGEAVARIIAERSEQLPGMAPGAEVICYTADCVTRAAQEQLSNPHHGMVFDHDQLELDPAEVASGIMTLARTHGAHLVNLSAGVFADPSQYSGLTDVIEAAYELGTVCVVAAGNTECEELAFPAYTPRCLSIGAIGCGGCGPKGSVAELERKRSMASPGRSGELAGYGPIFHWLDSAYGPGLRAVAPGVGIVVPRGGRPAFDLVGTSFAAPVATGLLAVALSMDQHYLGLPGTSERADYAAKVFENLCRETTISARFTGGGVPYIPPGAMSIDA